MQKKGESQRGLRGIAEQGRAFDVLGFGENSIDVLATVPHWPAPDEKSELVDRRILPGGQIASALVGCARLGCRAQYIGVFGDDDSGRTVARSLEAAGVDTSACLTAPAANRSAFIIVHPSSGTRAVLWRRDPALNWPGASGLERAVAQARAVLLDTTDLEGSMAMAEMASDARVPVVLDIDQTRAGLERLLSHVDVLIAAEGFPEAHTGASSLQAAMRQLRDTYGSAAVVVTLGANGAVAWDGTTEARSPGYVVPVVDPTGAGDAFRAGFLTAWLDHEPTAPVDLRTLLDFANATAALSCRALGAQGGLPSKSEVLRLVTDGVARRSKSEGSARNGRHS